MMFEWESWYSVAVIAAYLAFFPVAVGMLRGLKSPDATHLDLMRTYGVGWGRTLISLRLPASVPFLLPALRLAAAAAVIGTVVAEVSIGLRGGIGRHGHRVRPGRRRRPGQAVGADLRRDRPGSGRGRVRHAAGR